MNINQKILPRFIVFEGLDGSGTTTQSQLLAKAFSACGLPHFITKEPTDQPVGRFIRQALAGKFTLTGGALARLFAADRHEHLYAPESGIVNRVEKLNEWVICDRYLFSSLAYQSLFCPFSEVYNLNNFPLPGTLFFLEVPMAVAGLRLQGRSEKEIFEENRVQQQVENNYKKIIDFYRKTPVDCFCINGLMSVDSIHQGIVRRLKERFKIQPLKAVSGESHD